jgi:hypothetical protein
MFFNCNGVSDFAEVLALAVHLIFRGATGVCGSAFLAVAGGTVADLFETRKLGT